MMRPCEFPGCRELGQKHHIVFRSQGGLNIQMNYKYLCAEHHNMGKESPHRNRKVDLQYKKELQEKYLKLFKEEEYTVKQIYQMLKCREQMIKKAFKAVPVHEGKYQREDIIRTLMGGRFY